MICIRTVKSFCNEDISLIENYDKAINDTQTWDCHHRKETDEGLSFKQMKELGLYYCRPASELIFLTHGEHMSLHNKGKLCSEETRQKQAEAKRGEKNPWYGKHQSEEIKRKRSEAMKDKKRAPFSEEWKQRMSEAHKGLHPSEETRQRMSEAQKDKFVSTETRKKHSEYRKGTYKVWNDENDHSKGFHYEK